MLRSLIGELLQVLVPPTYQEYRPALTEALQFFCEHLSLSRRNALLAAQMSLGYEATPSRRLAVTLESCPTLHKLGQLLARDPRLSLELRENLQNLESMVPTTSLAHFTAPEELQLEAPLAEGSVAVTVLCRYRGEVAVAKLLKPDLALVLEEEFALWSQIGDLLDDCCERYRIPALDYREVVESLVRLLRDELDPAKEQCHLKDAARRYADWAKIKIPAVLPCSTPALTVMEKIEGQPFLESGSARALLSTAIQALLLEPFFSSEDQSLFHADPHPGNLMITPEGQLALLDWGSTLSLDKARREQITQQLLDAWMRSQPGSISLTELLEPSNWGGDLPADVLILRKILFHLEGMVATLEPGHDLTLELFMGAALRIGSEFPLRFVAPLTWRGFPSHLSTLDLARVGVVCWSRFASASQLASLTCAANSYISLCQSVLEAFPSPEGQGPSCSPPPVPA
jgi:ubiquinone biosynthesis protein